LLRAASLILRFDIKIFKLLGKITSKIFQDQISVFLIGGAFVIIAFILAIHLFNTGGITSTFDNTNASNEERIDFFREINTSNLNLFSIILTLFGAWVGAVLAFYFGSQSIDKAYSSLNQAQESINKLVTNGRLTGIKVSQIIAKTPDSMTLLKFKLTDKVNKIVKDAKDKNYKHVMITDESGLKVLGLLFISDLTKVKTEAELLKVEEGLQAFIETNEIIDDITKTKWGKQGVKNFVTVNMDDTLKNVVDKMKELDDSLSVRAVVMEKDAPKAIVTYDMISKELQK
jgi:hypothetical protein